jgi:hypothetical protein
MENHEQNIKTLLLEIKDKIGKPVSDRVVRAAIESCGIREKDTYIDFGFESIKALADYIFKELCFADEHKGAKNIKERESSQVYPKFVQISDYLMVKAKIFAQYYPLGIFHLFPVFIQITSILLFGYSLWTFIGFNQAQSTAVVLGVIIGLITTGGFVQVIGRQASFYWNHEDYIMTRQTINYLLRLGSINLVIVLFAFFVLNGLFYIYPFGILIIASIYAFLIGLLLLVLAPFHTIKQRWVISFAISFGTGISILLKTQTEMMVYFTHWIGIAIAITISKIFLVVFFKRFLAHQKHNLKPKVKTTVILYHNYQYFCYGLFLYIFIFIDRILAWSSTIDGPLPFVIYFNKNYELGMDAAILVLLLLSGVLEYGIASFSKFLDIGEKNTSYKSSDIFNRQLINLYWQQIILLFLTGTIIFGLFYILSRVSWGFAAYLKESMNEVILTVGIVGGLGYFFLAWGMLNTLYLFTLGQPSKPLKAIVLSCVLNLSIGFIFSRFIGYDYSVFGMLCGSVLFLILTLKANIDFLKKLDYYYYAAY